jgi:hypothetical protein
MTAEVRGERDFRFAVVRLARHLKAVEGLRDRPAKELKPWVQRRHQRAGDRLGGRTFTATDAEFVGAWQGVRYAAGDDVVKLAWELAQRAEPPPEAGRYDDPRVGRLMGLCVQLQHENERSGWGDGFALSGYTVEALLGVSQRTASTWLKMLVADDFLVITKKGGGPRRGPPGDRVPRGRAAVTPHPAAATR